MTLYEIIDNKTDDVINTVDIEDSNDLKLLMDAAGDLNCRVEEVH